jgi:hypothetical protein
VTIPTGRASDTLALEVGRASYDEMGWTLERVGLEATAELLARIDPLRSWLDQTRASWHAADEQGREIAQRYGFDLQRRIGHELIAAGAAMAAEPAPPASQTPKKKAQETKEPVLPNDTDTGRLGFDFHYGGCGRVPVQMTVEQNAAVLDVRQRMAKAYVRLKHGDESARAEIAAAYEEIGTVVVEAAGGEAALRDATAPASVRPAGAAVSATEGDSAD